MAESKANQMISTETVLSREQLTVVVWFSSTHGRNVLFVLLDYKN